MPPLYEIVKEALNIYVYLVFPISFYLSYAGKSINKEIHLKKFGTILGQSERDLTVLNKT